MTPQGQLQGATQGQASQAPGPQQAQGAMFQSPQSQQQPDVAAGRQLVVDAAQVSAAIKQFVGAHPDMSDVADQMLQVLKQGVTRTMSQLQQGKPGGNPAYA